MRKIFIIAFLIFTALSLDARAQTTRSISEMIAASEKTNGLLAGLMGDMASSDNAEITILSAVTFPNSVQVKYLGEVRKLGKPRKKSTDRWLKEYAKTPDEKKFYVNEIAVEENGQKYWIIAHETLVVGKLKSAKNGDEITLKVKILGYNRKGQTTDYLLMADGAS